MLTVVQEINATAKNLFGVMLLVETQFLVLFDMQNYLY
jgi:hypothetical protein